MFDDYFDLFKYILGGETEGISILSLSVLIIIEAVLIFLSAVIVNKKRKISYRKMLHLFLIVAYLTVILTFTILRRPVGSKVGEVYLNLDLGFGLRGYTPSFWSSTMSILNIILFIPWGFLVCPFLKIKKLYLRIFISTIIGMITSVLIENYQLLSSTGRFEVTDIVTNTYGTLVGAVIAAIVFKKKI
ncbi:VanZ family protein [Butyrivibrio sp. AE3006]|uniref:VanZ family protein n=1 Tax=Butyrivibrio sp. AE3006 TaxID=1280673 RepID=UPI00041EAC72|nr:VanZ family protein [Butyrivibrio sp. AE3006]